MPRLHPRARLSACLVGLALAALISADGAADEAAPRQHVVEIEAFAFVPMRLEVRPGDSVAWVNRDLAPHTVSAADGTLDSGELAKEDTLLVRFDRPGRLAYLCAFHPNMHGVIVVAP